MLGLHIMAGSLFLLGALSLVAIKHRWVVQLTFISGVVTMISGVLLLLAQPGTLASSCARGLVLSAVGVGLYRLDRKLRSQHA